MAASAPLAGRHYFSGARDCQRAVRIDDELQEVQDVARVQRGRIGGHQAGQVGQPDDRHAVLLHDLAFLGQGAVAAAFDGQVDQHRAGLHGRDGFRGHQRWRGTARDQGRGDDKVRLLAARLCLGRSRVPLRSRKARR
ncbi:hypothetical protein G6F57_021425 [Rhizopus arrhizus]|nr:hypothetical protein G6F57_021425 [Rhizopus arrhizus]